MRPRIFAFVALLGAIVAALGACLAPQALAAPAEVKLQVNQNCKEPAWPCWTAETSVTYPLPASTVTIADGGKVEFVEHDTSTPASVNWIGGGSPPACTGVPTTATLNWEGSCKFEQPGIYRFESATMFKDAYENYRQYEIVVSGTPQAKTTPANTELQTEATLTGSIEPEGNPTAYHFEYGSGSVSEHSTVPVSLGVSDFTSHSVSLPVSGLLPGTEYHFELIVSYEAGKTVSGGPQTFTTPPAAEPTVSTLAASDLQETEATLNGKVDPEGGAKSEYFFEWGAGSGGTYEHITMAVSLPSDGAEHQASTTVTGLVPGTEYHFRVVAQNALGAMPVLGLDQTFTTFPAHHEEAPPHEQPPTTLPSMTQTTTSTTPGGEASAPLIALGSSAHAARRGSAVTGALEVSAAGAGGRLEIDVLAKGSALGKGGRSAAVRVGRLLRGSVSAGNVPFTVKLDAAARHALKRLRHLALTVKVTLTPDQGRAMTITYKVHLRR